MAISNEYSISFDVFPIRFDDGFTNIMYFEENRSGNEPGNRVPAVFFNELGEFGGNQTTRSFYFLLHINGHKSSIESRKWYGVGKWHHIEIIQKLIDEKLFLRIIIDRDVIKEIENSDTLLLDDVTVYTSNPWNQVLDGYVKNIHINSGNYFEVSSLLL